MDKEQVEDISRANIREVHLQDGNSSFRLGSPSINNLRLSTSLNHRNMGNLKHHSTNLSSNNIPHCHHHIAHRALDPLRHLHSLTSRRQQHNQLRKLVLRVHIPLKHTPNSSKPNGVKQSVSQRTTKQSMKLK